MHLQVFTPPPQRRPHRVPRPVPGPRGAPGGTGASGTDHCVQYASAGVLDSQSSFHYDNASGTLYVTNISVTGLSLTTINGFNFPTSDGSSGQCLMTNGSGTLSWVSTIVSSGSMGDVQISNGSGGLSSVVGINDSNTGIITAADFTSGILTSITRTTPVANGTYTVGIGSTQNGVITITNGVITAIQQAS